MIKYVFILLLILLSFISSNLSFAECENSCDEATSKKNNTETIENQEINHNEELSKSIFNYTKTNVTVKKLYGVSIYTINQNHDSSYNMGYALGKSIVLHHPDYPKDLRNYLDQYIQDQSQFKMDDVVNSIAKSLPCWLIEEMQGFANAINTPEDGIDITYKDIVMLNSVVLWTRLPKKPPKAPPATPTSVKPLKLKELEKKELSPVSPVSDQVSFVISLASSEVKEGYPLVGKSYRRHYYNFFNKYPSVIVYNLNNTSFINIGFAGLLTVMSAMNNEGIVINTVQTPYQYDMSVVGSTPPNVSARIAIEVSNTLLECSQVLNTQISSIEMTYIINDEKLHYVLDSNIKDNKISKNEILLEQDKFFVFNIRNKTIVDHIQNKLKTAKITNNNVNLNDFINIFTSQRMYNIDIHNRPESLKSIYSVIYSPAMKCVYVAMPPIIQTDNDKKLIKLDFDSIELYSYSNLEDKEESKYYNKYNNEEEQK